MAGIEPATSAWKAEVLPLNYIRIFICAALNLHLICICYMQLLTIAAIAPLSKNFFWIWDELKLAISLIHFDPI